ncbi:pentapeptide repeat-containing protein [Nostoc sp. B(2019)]|nr:pentapeptide repeat-containing protein [Nostoc sp. B(2019)]
MKNLISIALNSWFKEQKQSVLLFNSITAADEIALMLNGQWDGCNGVMMAKCDEVAVNTAAQLLQATWCYQGDSKAVLDRLTNDQLLRRYAMGERNFVNANLRCTVLASMNLGEINLSYAKLSWANLSQVNLTQADLTAADLNEANLSGADLTKASLVRANLTKANLQLANLKGANLSMANLSGVNLTDADLRGANLALADLRGVNFHYCDLSGANLTGAKFFESEILHSYQQPSENEFSVS